ncbi:amino acid ABC transporter substrate-binding protein [Geomonas silvestris]|uniref:Amino acid ABC transporter substrate-binding protein n=1 Tax=Geomonas silvestris TaxID=2740184 RepID=A0A6V8MG97_9BACT|nr:transporter substrate-binding domain-containing protein [Geomonas silvestris]GFO58709.1 amino acid ABC transporter substrate-binding protein [Geomonas silvestris]
MSNGIKWLFFIALVLCLQMAASVPARAAGKPLVVGMELAYPPFEMTDASGKPDGVSVQLAYELGKALGRPVEIKNMAFDGLIPALKTGKIDLIISSMTATAERAKSIDFSDPYLSTGLCLLVNKKVPGSTIADFDQPGRAIAVKKGTTGHLYASNNLKKAKVLVLDKEAAAVLEVVQGKADAFIYDQMSTYQNFQRNRETTRPILKPFQTESWAIGLRKGNDELKAKVNRFLFEFRKTGGFGKLGDRYLKEEKDAFKQLGYPFFL